MRLFFALWPDAAVRQRLAHWAADCKVSTRGRATRSENLHATLAFLGEVEPATVPALRGLGAAIRAAGFELTLDRVDYWPHNRIVYAGCSEPPAALGSLAAELRARLSGAGYRVESRAYVPHVTLVRDARRALIDVAIEPVLWRVCDIALVESVRDRSALVYRPIQRFTLAM